MGFSLSWIALRPSNLEQACNLLQLKRTGEFEDTPDSDYSGIELKNGWTLITSDHSRTIFCDNKEVLKVIPAGVECVACFIEEHVMCSSSQGWRDGKIIWSIEHASDQGPLNLDVKGELPAQFDEIAGRLRTKQEKAGGKKADVDYIFDIPLEVAKAIVGYKHDEASDDDNELQFEVLLPLTPPKKPGLFRRLLGF